MSVCVQIVQGSGMHVMEPIRASTTHTTVLWCEHTHVSHCVMCLHCKYGLVGALNLEGS